MSVHFCQVTGERIAAPGVSKSVDPVNGQDDASERPTRPQQSKHESAASDTKAAGQPARKD